MTATVFIDYEVSREFVIPNVASLEEAEAIAVQMLEDEGQDFEVVSIDSFESGEEQVN